jgi:hypothetical protein
VNALTAETVGDRMLESLDGLIVRMADSPLTAGQRMVVVALVWLDDVRVGGAAHVPPVPADQLAINAGMSVPAVHRALAAAEEAGLIRPGEERGQQGSAA